MVKFIIGFMTGGFLLVSILLLFTSFLLPILFHIGWHGCRQE